MSSARQEIPRVFWNSTVRYRVRYTYITDLLHNVFISNYCSDMFRPRLSAIFKELAILSAFCSLRIKLCGRDSTHQRPNIITLETFKRLKSVLWLNTVNSYKVHTPTNALFIKLDKVLKFTLKITLTCSYIFLIFC